MKKPDTTQRLEEALSELDPKEQEDLRAMWRLSADADETPDISNDKVDALWQTLAAAADTKSSQPVSPTYKQDRPAIRKTRRYTTRRLLAGFTVAAAIAITGIVLWFQPLVKTAPYGEQLAVSLPDGSLVELNSGSTITYPRFFTGNRSISLQGEAYFDVRESDVPFIVETFNAEVRVLGTTFNVKAWETGWRPESKVTLTSGSIRLSKDNGPERSLVMVPGQTVTVRQAEGGFLESESENTEHVLAWRKGELVFKDQELVSVLEEIERRFGAEVELRVNQLAQKEVTFAYRQVTSIEPVLEDLCHALDLQYRPISSGYELFEE